MRYTDREIRLMRRALVLAERARGSVEPNPMVGAVVVRNNRVVGEGFHRRFGGPHAEVEALRKAGPRAKGAEMFVTLEPCNHYGKTPPCADAVIAAGISRVVIAMKDPFEKVSGGGIALLRKAGIKVDVGLLEKEARALNAPYLKLRTTKLPYVTVKYAMTADGRIATASGDSRWISCEASRGRVHRIRGMMDAIVIGVETAIADDPLLTARPAGARTPVRIVLDSTARLPLRSKLVTTASDVPLIVAVTKAAPLARRRLLESAGAEVVTLPGTKRGSLAALLRFLGKREMTNVLVEGGAAVIGGFIDERLVDEMIVFMAPKIAGAGKSPIEAKGVRAMRNALVLQDVHYEKSGSDMLMQGRVAYRANPRKATARKDK